MHHAAKRQQFLVDQGYSYKIITQLPVRNNSIVERVVFDTIEEQAQLLKAVMGDVKQEAENIIDYGDLIKQQRSAPKHVSSLRKITNQTVRAISPPRSRAYAEF